MQKKLITLAVAAALTAPLAAQADATMYGRLNLWLEGVDTSVTDVSAAGAWQGTNSTSNVGLRSDSSKIGVKGSEDLGNGLKAIYQMEWTVNMMDQDNVVGGEFRNGNNALSTRNIFAGLTGDWGTFIVGRHDTPLKISTGKLDYFADSAADYDNGHMMAGFADRRADQALAYISPNWNGLTLAAALVPGENGVENTGPVPFVNNFGRSGADTLADAYSLAAMYENSGFYGSLAYEAGDGNLDALGANDGNGTLDAGLGDLSQWRLGLGYDGGFWKVAGVYEDMEVDVDQGRGGTALDVQRWMINGAYSFGNATIKASYFDSEGDCADAAPVTPLCRPGAGMMLGGSAAGALAGTVANQDGDGWAIGLDYALSKRTDVGVLYATSNYDTTYASAPVVPGVNGISSLENEVFAAGISHKF